MRKLFFILPLVAVACIACNKEIINHETTIARPSSGTSVMAYADQEWDSIAFYTTESYTLETNVPWCRIPQDYRSFQNTYVNTLIYFVVPFRMDANTSGVGRFAVLSIKAGDYSAAASVYQYPFLNITIPGRLILPTESGEVFSRLADLQLEGTETISKVAFNVFGNWTITPKEGAWLHVELGQESGQPGSHEVTISLGENNTGADRRDTLLLTSRGVTDKIPVLQLKK